MRMNDVASKAHITRATLGSIEKGRGGFSAFSLFNVMNVLGLSFNLSEVYTTSLTRTRATRVNSSLDKKINRFITMCIEQYALYAGISSHQAYKKMSEKGLIKNLTDDYEDLHGESREYLNDYIDILVRRK